MEIVGIMVSVLSVVSAIVGIAAFVRNEIRHVHKRRAMKRLAAAAVFGFTAVALIGLLSRRQ